MIAMTTLDAFLCNSSQSGDEIIRSKREIIQHVKSKRPIDLNFN